MDDRPRISNIKVWLLGLSLLAAGPAFAIEDPVEPKAPLIDPLQLFVEKLDFANGLFQREFYEMALEEYEALASDLFDHPRYEEVHLGRAESLFFLKRYRDALMRYRGFLKAFEQTRHRPVVIIRLGQCWYHLGKYGQAASVFAKLTPDALPEDLKSTYRFYYGSTLKALGRYALAKSFYDQLLQEETSGPQSWIALVEAAQTEAHLGHQEQALVWLNKASELAVSDRERSRTLLIKGEKLFEWKRYEEAAVVFQQVMEQFPSAGDIYAARSGYLLALFQLKRFDEILAFRKSASEDWDFLNRDYEILKAFIRSADAAGQPAEALRFTDEALAKTELSAERRSELSFIQADLLVRSKNFERLQQLLEILPSGAEREDERLFLKAEAGYGVGDFVGAQRDYDELLTKFPESPRRWAALYGRAFAQREMGQVDQSLQTFESILQQSDDETKRRDAAYQILLLHHQQSDWPRAEASAESFLSMFPESPEAQQAAYLIGFFRFKQSRYPEAISAFESFVQNHSESALGPHAYFYMGYSAQSLDQAEQAFKFYDQIPLSSVDAALAVSTIKNRALMYLKAKDEPKAAEELRMMMDYSAADVIDAEMVLWLIEYDIRHDHSDAALAVIEKAKTFLSGNYIPRLDYATGEIHRKNRRCEQALPAYKAALQGGGESSVMGMSMVGMADCLGQEQKYDEASRLLTQAVQSYSEDVMVSLRVKFAMAQLEELQGNFEKAGKLYLLAAVLYKDDVIVPEALFKAGQIFEKLQRKIDAVKAYSEIIQDYPASAQAAGAQERIKVLQ